MPTLFHLVTLIRFAFSTITTDAAGTFGFQLAFFSGAHFRLNWVPKEDPLGRLLV